MQIAKIARAIQRFLRVFGESMSISVPHFGKKPKKPVSNYLKTVNMPSALAV
jgi:hypothetical protein